MTDLFDRLTVEPELPEEHSSVARPPLVPVVMLGLCAVTSAVLVVVAASEGAGSTEEVSTTAVLAWLLGSVVGLLLYAWFGLLDAGQRGTGSYIEPGWRPRSVVNALAVAGWLSGAAGAVLVAQAVARR